MNKLIKYFNPAELISFAYILITAVYIGCFSCKIDNAASLLLNRAIIAGLFVLIVFISIKKDNKLLNVIRHVFPLSLTIYWYPETYYLNECIFSNLDHLFIHADEWLFGCQPAFEFSKHMPYKWLSELMSFAYFSYFLMINFIGFYFYFAKNKNALKILFIVLCSFLIYYVLFIILPVVGPQFYFAEPQNQVPDGYWVRKLLVFIQTSGEKPTGAFPSSHVGVSLIMSILVYKHARRFFPYFFALVILLIFSTVYIKAHYLIDVIGGFVSAPIIYLIGKKLWGKFAE